MTGSAVDAVHPERRFTVSTDPDGQSYLFGRNHPEPYDGYLTGGTPLFAWEPEAVAALAAALDAAQDLENLNARIQQRIAHAELRLAERGSEGDYWRGALVAACSLVSDPPNPSPPESALMQVDPDQPVPSSTDSGESRSSAAGPESEHAEPRRAGAPPPEASSYAGERLTRVANPAAAAPAVHPERPAMLAELVESWRQVADDFESAQDPADHSRYMEAATNCLRDCADALAAALPSPPVAPQAAVDVTALPEWDALVEEIDGRDSIPEGAYSVLHRSTLAVADHAVELVAAARRAAGEADRG